MVLPFGDGWNPIPPMMGDFGCVDGKETLALGWKNMGKK